MSSSFNQRTLSGSVSCQGIGLHTGGPVTLTLRPAPANHGVVFVRTDLQSPVSIPATAQYAVESALSTSLGKDGVRVGTVEHLLGALLGLGVDNVRVELDGPEVPIMDGSAGPFAYLVQTAGVRVQEAPKSFVVVKKPVLVREGDKEASLSPCDRFRLDVAIDFHHPLVPRQRLEMDFSGKAFVREVSRARTFGFLRDVERLKAAGLALGGSLDNAIVIDDFSILNADGLRFPDEFVRHKALDAMGDLALFGHPVIGHLKTVKSGHTLHLRLVREVLGDPSAYTVVQAKQRELERFGFRLPDFAAELA